MITRAMTGPPQEGSASALQNLPRLLFAPVPLPLLQIILGRLVMRIARDRPGLFDRIGPHKTKRFLIDPLNMPFVMMLRPDPACPHLMAARRRKLPVHDARIAGSFLTLLDMIDGRLDGDALFFTRDLIVEGDTEAVVCLRNALDDLEGSIADDIAAFFGPPGKLALAALRKTRNSNNDDR